MSTIDVTQTDMTDGGKVPTKFIWNWGNLYLAVLAFNTVNFVIAYFVLNDLSIVDITWGIMFIIPNGILVLDKMYRPEFEGGEAPGIEAVSIKERIVFGMVAFWAIRLAVHIGKRHKGEDYRYIMIRKRWAHRGPFLRFLFSYLYIFGMQGLFSMVNNGSAIHIMWYSKKTDELGAWEISGIVVWVIGFLFEVIGDAQLQAHRDDESKRGTIITSGLWRITRHPNYFGECFAWWGVYLLALGGESGVHNGWATFYSALFITLLIRYVSGVAMLERKQKKKAAFRVYMMETSAFIPWCYKKIEGEEREQLLEKFQKEIDEEQAAEDAKTKDVEMPLINEAEGSQ